MADGTSIDDTAAREIARSPVVDAWLAEYKEAGAVVTRLGGQITGGLDISDGEHEDSVRRAFFGMPLMAIAGAWVVLLYMRSQRPAWITIGAGARIGLVTGLVGGWTAAATTGVTLFALRFWFHQGRFYDDLWQTLSQQMSQQWTSMGVDSQTIAEMQRMLLPPEGRAAWLLAALTMLAMVLLLFAVAGGAIGARVLARRRKPEI